MLKRKLAKKTLLDMYESRLPQFGAPGGTAGVGKVFFVNGSSGSDSGSGITSTDPFKTVTYALTKCTNRNDDTILVTRDTTEADYPVSITKRDIHIFGWDAPTGRIVTGEKILFNYGGDSAAFEINANNVELAGFELCGDSTHAGIEIGTYGVWDLCVHNCIFGMRGATQDGLKISSAMASPYMNVYDCYFGSAITRDGIRLEGNSTRGWIGQPGHGNVFDVGEIGIDIVGAATLGGIFDNRFIPSSDTSDVGESIYFKNASSSGCYVDGNRTGEGTAAMTKVPYCDLGSNHWGVNYYDIRAIMPDTSG